MRWPAIIYQKDRNQMNDAQSTIAGLKLQDCPGGGWTGQPAELERPTVADCLAHGVCGCIYGGAVQHIERLRAERDQYLKSSVEYGNQCERLRAALVIVRRTMDRDSGGSARELSIIDAALNHQQQVGETK